MSWMKKFFWKTSFNLQIRRSQTEWGGGGGGGGGARDC